MNGKDMDKQDDREQLVWADEKLEEIDGEVSQLAEIAGEIVGDYWYSRIAGNMQRIDAGQRNRQSVMGVRVRLRDGYLSIEWYYNTFFRRRVDNRWGKPLSRHIRKKKGSLTYAHNVLLRKAQAWEEDLILEAEEKFIKIRERYRVLAKQRTELRRVRKMALKVLQQEQ